MVCPPAVQPSDGERALTCKKTIEIELKNPNFCPFFNLLIERDLRHKCVWVEPGQLLRAVDPPDFPPVLAVVVHEHVLADAEEGGWVHLEGRGHRNLGVSCHDKTIW